MTVDIARMEIRYEQDVVRVRQRARLIAQSLGFGQQDQTRISTAVSEIARNAFQYARGGEAHFALVADGGQRQFVVTVQDHGPGIGKRDEILAGRRRSTSGMGVGLPGARRLVDDFTVESTPGAGTTVQLAIALPQDLPPVTPEVLGRIAEVLAATVADSPMEEIRLQNTELVAALEQLRERDETLGRLNSELTATNAGIVALNARLEEKARRLETAQRDLQARNDDLKTFAYTVSHDLKAPLRGIAGYANELERKHRAGLTERGQFCITQILAAAANLDRLIEDLLMYSRLDAEHPTPTVVSLPEAVQTILKDRALTIAERGAEVTLDLQVASLTVWQRGLLQALTNLIDNALKYSHGAAPPRITIRSASGAASVTLSVTDNGIGFDMKYHDRIFGLFNRLVRGEEFEGTGAGLAIVKKLVERQGGKVWAESQAGAGATFYLQYPTQPPGT